MKARNQTLAVAALLLAGCRAVGPTYHPPEPVAFTAALPGPEQGEPLTPEEAAAWWTALGDPALTRLIEQTLAGNRTLRGALSRVREARAKLRLSRAGLLPQVDASGAYTHYRSSQTIAPALEGDRYQAGFDASWEMDVFGRRRRAVEAAQAAFEAETATLEQVWVSLAAETAQTYVRLQTARRRHAVVETNLELQAQSLELVAARARAGLGDDLAVEQARYSLEKLRATLPRLKAEEEAALNALAVLTGLQPGELAANAAPPAPIPGVAPRVLKGIPADLLRRRPDVRAAERRLAAQTARVGMAEADRYPVFRLAGSVGLETLDLSDFFRAESHFFSWGPSVHWPIFHGGSIRANIEVQHAALEQELAAYEEAALNAVRELRDALSDYAREFERQAALILASDAAGRALAIAQDLYRNGLRDFDGVLDAQRTLAALGEEMAISESHMTLHLIRVYKALGGGWAPWADPEAAASEPR